MSDLLQQLDLDLHQAMRDRDETRKLTLRSAKTALSEAMRAGTDHTLNEAQVIAVLQKEAKRRREAAAEFDKAGATQRADAERAELAVLETYLPKALDDAEIEKIAVAVIAQVGATSQKDFGKVMGPVIAQVAGRADGKQVGAVVRKLLPA